MITRVHIFLSIKLIPIPKKVNKLVNLKIVNLEMEVGIKR